MVTVCISHKEDVDGVVSATMLKAVFNSYTFLVDYTDFIQTLEHVAQMQDIDNLFICDLGLSKSNEGKFIEILSNLRKKGVNVTYIDHHDLGDAVRSELISNGVNLVHTVDECTSVQIYTKYTQKLSKRFSLLAVAAAIVDDMKNRPIANKLYKMYDKQYVFFEATSLSYAIYSNQHDSEFLHSLVDKLQTKTPHEIERILDSARDYAQRVTENISVVENNAKKLKNLVHVEARDLSTSIVANMLLATYQDMEVALAYKQKDGNYVLSLRGADSSTHHLGRIVNKLSMELGGSGGGHERACGGLIPKDRFDQFMQKLDAMLS